jgi:hypothetical protein
VGGVGGGGGGAGGAGGCGAGRRWKRERGEKGREEKYSMTCGLHQLAVGIEDGLRVWMDAGELDLDERILMTRIYRG